MRKYDRNAAFNILFKAILSVVTGAGCFMLLRYLCRFDLSVSAAVSALAALLVVLLFSFLLRYTRFYYAYYSFVSHFLFTDKAGNVYCPCCGKHFGQFRDERFYEDTSRFNPSAFAGAKQDVICDFCRSAPRHRIIAEWADLHINKLRSSRILYFAPELSMMLWFRRNGIHPSTADLYDRRAALRLDITAIDLPDNSQDIVVCNHVLEHVSDYELALSELHRILRSRGILIISFPVEPSSDSVIEMKDSTPEERIRYCGQHDHLRLFGNNSAGILENAGFEVSTIDLTDMPDDIMPVTGPACYDTNKIFCCIRK